jgi:hypothetical protein
VELADIGQRLGQNLCLITECLLSGVSRVHASNLRNAAIVHQAWQLVFLACRLCLFKNLNTGKY